MTSVLVLLYTTLGGVLGAGLTQYVTQVRDRRSARATVIERVAAVEASRADLRWPPKPPWSQQEIQTLYVSYGKNLAQLEAGGLIAGVPRATLLRYIETCRITGEIRRYSLALDCLENTLAAEDIPDSAARLRKRIAECGAYLTSNWGTLDRAHDAALDQLRAGLWDPLIASLHKNRLRKLEKEVTELHAVVRDIGPQIREFEDASENLSAALLLRRDQKDNSDNRPLSLAVVTSIPAHFLAGAKSLVSGRPVKGWRRRSRSDTPEESGTLAVGRRELDTSEERRPL